MGTLRRDVAFAVRTLIKSPVISITALVTIALGIGATTAIFSVVNTVLLQPLPYENRDRLAFVTGDLSARNVLDFPMAPADFADLRTTVKSFDEVAGLVTGNQPMFDDRGEARILRVAFVTPNIFRTLGERLRLVAISWMRMVPRSVHRPGRAVQEGNSSRRDRHHHRPRSSRTSSGRSASAATRPSLAAPFRSAAAMGAPRWSGSWSPRQNCSGSRARTSSAGPSYT
jgi:hypothetical protein